MTYSRWATPDEVEEELNGSGIPGASWVLVSGEILEGTAQFDMTVPIWDEEF